MKGWYESRTKVGQVRREGTKENKDGSKKISVEGRIEGREGEKESKERM